MAITIDIGVCLIGIAMIMVAGLVIYISNDIINLMKERNDNNVRVALMGYDFAKARDMIDTLVSESGTKYKIDNYEYKPIEDQYMTKDQIKGMIEYIQKDVIHYITPELESLLQIYVNIESEEDLMKFIYSRVELYVMNYVIEVNRNMKQD